MNDDDDLLKVSEGRLRTAIVLAFLLGFTAGVLALMLIWAEPARADGVGHWQSLSTPRGTDLARVTYYGEGYAGRYCASGIVHRDDGWYVALGPSMLKEARRLSNETWPRVRLTLEDGRTYDLPVRDTGAAAYGYELEVDLPGDGCSGTWGDISGLSWGAGLFYARVEVWVPGRMIYRLPMIGRGF